MKRHWLLRVLALALALCLCTASAVAETLKKGDKGASVVILQQALQRVGYAVGNIDGVFGTQTDSAVRAFQQANGLKVDGKAGTATQTLLYRLAGGGSAVPTAAPSTGSSSYFGGNYDTLRPGDEGERVRRLQSALNSLGYPCGNVDGVYGTGTTTAVQAFQARQGLKVDGKAGSMTLQRMEALLSGASVPTAQPTAKPTAAPTTQPTANPGGVVIPTRVLRYGYTGADVLSVQQRLQTLGYYTGALNSTYTSATIAAVRAFQQRNGLKVDGLAGSDTNTRLFSSSAISATAQPTAAPTAGPGVVVIPTRVLRLGATGADVLSVQQRLQVLGYYTGALNSTYDAMTMAAVHAFQVRNGLEADGKAGSATNARLFSAAAIGAAPQATAQPTAHPTANPTTAPTTNPGTVVVIPTRVLRLGYTGADVLSVQQRLQVLGYYTGVLNSTYDVNTMAAVRAFQVRNGLEADGLAGSDTNTRLFSSLAISAAPQATVQPTASPTTQPTASPTTAPTTNPGGVVVIPTRVLRLGATGTDVLSVQQRLQVLGYYTGALNSTYDAATMVAVRAFQVRNGLEADGLAGSDTNTRLFSSLAIGAAPQATVPPTVQPTQSPSTGWVIPTRTLRSGMEGDDVASVQRRLQELGYYSGTITGEYRIGTVNAVVSFQRLNGLNADGVAGKATYGKLFSNQAVAAPQATTPPQPQPTTPPQTSYPVLRSGATGENVSRLQTRLQALGYNVQVTGVYDTATVSAVRTFQTNNYLTTDGIAGNETQTILYSDAARTASQVPDTSYTTLDVNTAQGTEALVTMQQRLSALGYPLKLNGKYDGDTHNAVVAFQQRNNLVISGIANGATQSALYASTAKPYSTPVDTLPEGTGWMETPKDIQLLWWYKEVKPLLKGGSNVVIFDPETNLSWNIKVFSMGHHADSQPITWQDTQIMNRSFGKTSWDCHPVYVKIPDGRWILAAMHNYPHNVNGIMNNGFGGHLCIHFLREYDECIANGDSNYGVQMQDAIRKRWKAMTGIDVP